MSLGAKLKQLRLENNLTQLDLAERVGKQPSHISRYETDRIRPSKRTIELFAKELGVSKEELLKEGVRPTVDSFKDRELAHLMHELDDLEEPERRAVKVVLEAVVMKKNLRRQLLSTAR